MAACHSRQISILSTLNLIAIAVCVSLSGCAGKSLVDDNPVFAAAPPRGSYSNKAQTVSNDVDTVSVITPVSQTKLLEMELTGNTIVAEVNGKPIFVDDLVGSMRLTLEDNKQITPEQRQQILLTQINGRLPSFVEQEIVLSALNKAIPPDRQEEINKSLEAPFGGVLDKIKADRAVETDTELNEILAEEGLSIAVLRESFVRMQKVQGYLSTLAETPQKIERPEIVAYYEENLDEFTSGERVRWQELVIRFDKHDGREGAEKVMADVVQKLQDGEDFAELATSYSDSLSAEKRGDMGWLTTGSLADKTLEKRLFELKPGEMTKVFVRNDRFEVYRVIDHQMPRTAPLAEVQNEIEAKIVAENQATAREDALTKLREAATVVTLFDDAKKNAVTPVSFSE